MKVAKDEFDAANARATARLRKNPCATKARYERKRDRVVIGLSTGIEVAFRPRDAQGLERARPDQLDRIEISPSGLGIHFPKLDADIYLPALLEDFLGSKSWIAAAHGRIGGSVSTRVRRPVRGAVGIATRQGEYAPLGIYGNPGYFAEIDIFRKLQRVTESVPVADHPLRTAYRSLIITLRHLIGPPVAPLTPAPYWRPNGPLACLLF